MIVDNRTGRYIQAVVDKIEEGRLTMRLPTRCPECDQLMSLGTESNHVVYRIGREGAMICIIGCEGYWCINPALVGVESENWQAPA